MNNDIFSVVDEAIRHAGTDDPFAVAEDQGILAIKINGTVTGYAATYKGDPVIGVNEILNFLWYMLTGWHEMGHVLDGHIYEARGQKLADFQCFAQEVNSLAVPRHEKIANLISANVCVKDDDVMEVTRYDSSLMQAYRGMRAYYEKLVGEMDLLRFSANASSSPMLKVRIHDLKNKINSVGMSLRDMENEIVSANGGKTFHEIASELGTNERILRYKLEAMRLRGLDIDPQELESYNRMFDGAIAESSRDI